jgi:hypothetical protein
MSRTGMTALLILAAVLGPAAAAGAAEVSANVSEREVFVGVPFALQISIENAEDYETPKLADMPGLEVLGDPTENRSSFTQIINGRMSQRTTVTLGYQLAATEAGSHTIGPITVVADGERFEIAPIRIVATTSQTGDLLFLEVAGERDRYFLGETMVLTLEIWLKPYRDLRTKVRLDQESMAQCIGRGTNLGPFEDHEQLRTRTELRTDAEGIEREYYVYRLRSRVTPQQPGTLAFDDVRVVVQYPVALERRRTFFDSRWVVSRTRPLVASVERTAIEIMPLPEEGKPPSFTGAVGRFDFEVTAKPTEVAVGDPVTLSMTVTDRTDGTARLEALGPPALDRVPALTERFRVPSDPLAGVVTGRSKTFTQTIRAKDEHVDRIPAIPFAYFDPTTERYAVARSSPIALKVEPASIVTASDVIGGKAARSAGTTELTEVAGGILANYSGPELLASHGAFALTWAHAAAVMVPPLAFVGVALGRRRALRLRDDRGYARRRSARRRALRRLREARQEAPARQAEAAALTLREYVADRCNLPAGGLTGAEAVQRLRTAGVPSDLTEDVDGLLSASEQSRYAGTAGGSDDFAERATRCVERLERVRIG